MIFLRSIGKGWKQYVPVLLLPLFFVLHGLIENYGLVSFKQAVSVWWQYEMAVILLVLFFFFITRRAEAAGFVAFATLFLFLFFGPLHDALKSISGNGRISSYTLVLPLLFVIIIALIVWTRRQKPRLAPFLNYLNLLLIVLILIEGVRFFLKEKNRGTVAAQTAIKLNPVCDSCLRPDIYLLIADGYAGAGQLSGFFNYDNSSFYRELKQRGFAIVDSSLSNYNYTPFTMASMLGMEYLEGLEGRNQSRSDRAICYRGIDNNATIDFFRNNGYEFKNFSIFRFAGLLPLETTSFYQSGADLITAHTLGGRINRDVRFNLVTRLKIGSEVRRVSYHEHALNNLLYTQTIDEAARHSSNPKFVYTHLEMPHYPYYYNGAGQPYPLEGLIKPSSHTDTAQYLQYLQYSNRKLLELVDGIRTRSAKPVVILLMSDHGFREASTSVMAPHYQFMNLNAVLLPSRRYDVFYPGITSVNQFRALINAEFSGRLPMLKDSTSFLRE